MVRCIPARVDNKLSSLNSSPRSRTAGRAQALSLISCIPRFAALAIPDNCPDGHIGKIDDIGEGSSAPLASFAMAVDPSLASESYCYLTTTGRVSGEPREIEIWFGLDGDTLRRSTARATAATSRMGADGPPGGGRPGLSGAAPVR